jgi:hypothetical protein
LHPRAADCGQCLIYVVEDSPGFFVPGQIPSEDVVQVVVLVRESNAYRWQEVPKPETSLLRESGTSLSPANEVTLLKIEPQLDNASDGSHPESWQPASERIYYGAVVIDTCSV